MKKLLLMTVILFSLALIGAFFVACGDDDDDDDSSDPSFEEDDDDGPDGSWSDCSDQAALEYYACKDNCPAEPSCDTPAGEYCDHYICNSECFAAQAAAMIICGETYDDPDARVDFWACEKGCQEDFQECLKPADQCNDVIYFDCDEDKTQCQGICLGM